MFFDNDYDLIEKFHKLVISCEIKKSIEPIIKSYQSLLQYFECQDAHLGNCNKQKFYAISDIKDFLKDFYKKAVLSVPHIEDTRQQNHDVIELLDTIDEELDLDTDSSDTYLPRRYGNGNWDVQTPVSILKEEGKWFENPEDINEDVLSDFEVEELPDMLYENLDKRQNQFNKAIEKLDNIRELAHLFDIIINRVHSEGTVLLDYIYKSIWQTDFLEKLKVDFDYLNFFSDEFYEEFQDYMERNTTKTEKLIDFLGTGKIKESHDLELLKKCMNIIYCDEESSLIDKTENENKNYSNIYFETGTNPFALCITDIEQKERRPMDVRKFR